MGTYNVDAEVSEDTSAPKEVSVPVRTQSRRKGAGTIQVVEFILGKEHFAIDLFDTREVITQTEVTPLPNTSSFLKGIIDLRGSITTIIDLADLMHITTEAVGKKKARIIVLDSGISVKPIGILVDDVFSVTTYSHEDIDREEREKSQNRDILGVIRKKGKVTGEKERAGLVIWLDIRKMIGKIEEDL